MVETRRSNRLRSRSADAAEFPSPPAAAADQEEQHPRPTTRTSPRRSAGRRKQRSYSETNLERRRGKNHQDDEEYSNTKLSTSSTTSAMSKNKPATAQQQQEKDIVEVSVTKKPEPEIPDPREENTKVSGKRLSSMDGAHVDNEEKWRLDDDDDDDDDCNRSSQKEARESNENPTSSSSKKIASSGTANKNGEGSSSFEEKRVQKTKPVTISSKSRVDSMKIKANNKTVASGKPNALSKLVPGYTAPPTLTSDSLMAKYRPAGGLEGLRRAALRSDPRTAKAMEASKNALHQQQGGSAVASGSSSSFKMGHCKRQRQPPGRAGDGWFGMRPTQMTDDVKKDLHLIRNRNYLDPKRFYKNPDLSGKCVQVGTVIEGPTEYYSSRLTKKQRRTNLVDEILADPSTAAYAQNKYKEMQREKTALTMKRKKGRRGKR